MAMTDLPIRTAAVVGTGVIGASWASLFLARGLTVRACDPAEGAEARLRAAVAGDWPVLERLGLSPGADPDRLVFCARLEDALDGADFVQESGPERLDVKIETFTRMDSAVPAEVILASSSSGLPMSQVQAAAQHPERIVLGHPFNPPHLIPLVEVMGGAATSDTTVTRAMEIYRALGKHPIHLHTEVRGHVANRLQAALWREAFHLVQTGAATVADVDAAIAQGPGLRWAMLGPFLNMHLSGGQGGMQHMLHHLGPAIQDWWDDLGQPRLTPELIETVVRQTEEAAQGRSLDDLGATRDGGVADILALKAKRDG